jgi:hypothetical protein
MKKLNSTQLQRLYKFLSAVAIISFVAFIALTWRRELQYPSVAAFLPLFIIGVLIVSKKAKKKAEESSEEK